MTIFCVVTFGNLVGSLFFAAILAKCLSPIYLYSTLTKFLLHADDGLTTTQPYLGYIQNFAMYVRQLRWEL